MEEFGDTIEKCFARMDEFSDTIEKRLHRGGMGLGGCFSRAKKIWVKENLLKLVEIWTFWPSSGPPLLLGMG